MTGTTRLVRFDVHEDVVDTGNTVWWAESPDVDGLYVGGDSLEELRKLAREAVELHVGPSVEVRFRLGEAPATVTR